MKNTVSLIWNIVIFLTLISYVWGFLNLLLRNWKQVTFAFVIVSFFATLICILTMSYVIFFSNYEKMLRLEQYLPILYGCFIISVLVFTVSSYYLVRETRKQQKVELK